MAPRSSIFETVLPADIFDALARRLSAAPATVLDKPAAVVRAQLLEAGATIRVSRTQLLQESSARDPEPEG